MTNWLVFETLSGTVLAEFEPTSGNWDSRLNTSDELSVTIPLWDAVEANRDWPNLATEWKHALAVEEGGRYYGGPIIAVDFDNESQMLSITARGIQTLLERRMILPATALFTPLVNPLTERPNDALDTHIADCDLGTIGKKLVQQCMTWPASSFPISFEADRDGTAERTYKAIELKPVQEAIDQLSGVQNGPDFDFRLIRIDGSHLGWQMISGTAAQPRLQGTVPLAWDLSAEQTSGADLKITRNSGRMASLSWATGGRGEDQAMVARAYADTLVVNRYPLLEVVDSSHTNTSIQATLDAWAAQPLRTGFRPWEFWSFRTKVGEIPSLQEYRVGDYCSLTIADSPWIPDGTYRRRIVAVAGDEIGDWVTITCGEAYDG